MKERIERRNKPLNEGNIILLGIGLATVASALQNFGMGFQKVGMERLKPISSNESLVVRIVRARIWLLGTLMTFCAWCFFLAALRYVGISIVQPIMIGGVVFLVFFAVILLKERVLPREGIGIVSCTLGAFLVTLEAEEVKYETINWQLLTLAGFVFLMLFCCAIIMLHSYIILNKSPLASGGAVAGILTGLGALFARSLTLEESQVIFFLISVHFWLLVICQACSLVFLQAAFHRERAITVVPLYGGFAVLIPVTGGILIFSEKLGLALIGGIALILVGILLLSRIGAEFLAPEEAKI